MKNIFKLSMLVISSALFVGCTITSHDRHADMSMIGKSCCCKSGSASESSSCSMHSKHDQHNENGILADSKNTSKGMMCNKGNEERSMKMKDKNLEKLFEKLDENSDGKISISEYLKLPDQKFNSLDANKDGYISKDEINGVKSNSHSHH